MGFLVVQMIKVMKPNSVVLMIPALLVVLMTNASKNSDVQSLSSIVRTIALKKITRDEMKRLLKRELFYGFLIGLQSTIVLFILIFIFYRSLNLSLLLSFSFLCSAIFAKWLGSLVLLFLYQWKRDLAIAAGPLILTINDLMGLTAYFFITTYLIA